MRILKWIAIGLAVVVGLVIAAAAVLYSLGGSRFEGPDLQPEAIQPATDSVGAAWGRHLTLTHGCTDCHGERLAGQVLVEAPPFRAVASNLTDGRGGVGGQLDAAGWERAIRHAVGVDGRGLMIMPSEVYTNLSDDEVAALIGYLQSVPAVDNELPATRIKPLGRIIAGTGGLAPQTALIDHAAAHLPVAPPMGATLEYGEHRVSTTCIACHGPRLEGGPPLNPSAPPGPALTHVADWTADQFRTVMQTGVTPAGRQLDPAFMPWPAFANFQDVEIEAIKLYIGTLAAADGAADAR